MSEKVVEKAPLENLEELKKYTERAFGKIFQGREKAKQRIVYDLLNYMKTNNRAQFLYQVLKLLTANLDDKDVRTLSKLINEIYTKYDTPENFEKLGYTIIMAIMSANGGE